MNVDVLLNGAKKVNASQVQLHIGKPPQLQIQGELKAVQAPPLQLEDFVAILKQIMPAEVRPAFEQHRTAQFAYKFGEEQQEVSVVVTYTNGQGSVVFDLEAAPAAETVEVGEEEEDEFTVRVNWEGFPKMDVDGVLLEAKRLKASDIHFIEGHPPYFRIQGDMKRTLSPPLTREDFDMMLKKMMPHHMHREYESQKGADFGYQIGNLVRFRVVAYYEMGGRGMVLRLVQMSIPTIEDLELPPVIAKIAENTRGMVLLTGMTGSGKSTTLAAMIDYMNNRESIRIITIEDPIEYVYTSKKAVISQREVGKDVTDFNSALRQAMRMDPDVILVGEMRDGETIKVAIKGAETGHLVMSTLHTTSATHTIQRIMGYFPDSEHDLLREQLSLNLKASITQRLVKRKNGKGRLAAQEIMVVNATIAKLIKENRIPDIFGVIKGRDDGMQTFDQGLADLVRADKITFEEGALYCEDFFAYKRFIAGISSTGDKGAILA